MTRRRIRHLGLLSLTLILVFGQAHASEKKTESEYEKAVQKLAPLSPEFLRPVKPFVKFDSEKMKLVKQQEAKRTVAADQSSHVLFEQKNMSPEYIKFRDEFLKIKSSEELDQKLTDLDLNYDKIPNSATDLKFIAAQIIPFRTFRGLVWRLIPPMSSSKISHSIVLTQVKNLAVSAKIFFPTDQWQAGVEYLTEPFVQNGVAPFTEKGKMITAFPDAKAAAEKNLSVEAFLQAYFIADIIPALELSAHRIEALDMSKKFAVWDNKFWYGLGSFPDAKDQYSFMGEVERLTALTNIYAGLSTACSQGAFAWDGAFAMDKKIGRLYGFDSFLGSVTGVPAEERNPVVMEFPQWGLFFQNNEFGANLMEKSWQYLAKSVEVGATVWDLMKKRPADERYLKDNSSAALPFQRPVQMRFNNLKAMVESGRPIPIRSIVTGEDVVVDLHNWYKHPVLDLKLLYGVGFDRSPEWIENKSVSVVDRDSHETTQVTLPKFRNYLKGRSLSWNLSEYRKLFPDLKSNEDLMRSARVLTQSWGGGLIAIPVAGYLD